MDNYNYFIPSMDNKKDLFKGGSYHKRHTSMAQYAVPAWKSFGNATEVQLNDFICHIQESIGLRLTKTSVLKVCSALRACVNGPMLKIKYVTCSSPFECESREESKMSSQCLEQSRLNGASAERSGLDRLIEIQIFDLCKDYFL